MKDYVVFYGPNDGASGYELRNAEKVIESFSADTEYTDINKVIELYNIKQYFDNEMYLTSWNESTINRYIGVVKQFNSVIGKFFSRVLGENIYEHFKSLNVHYRYLAVPEEWIDGECFLLEAYGDSMVDIGIDKGDLVLVKKTETANDGDVVVALTEDGNTLKRLFWENGKPRLHAENKTYTGRMLDFYPRELTIQGIALKVIKDIR